MKFVPAPVRTKVAKTVLTSKPEEFRPLTESEVKTNMAELHGMIVELVESEIVQRFTTSPGEPAISSADAMGVAIAAMAAAEGLLAVKALGAGLPVEKVREIHDRIYTAVLREEMPK